jgi:hypothetical protein
MNKYDFTEFNNYLDEDIYVEEVIDELRQLRVEYMELALLDENQHVFAKDAVRKSGCLAGLIQQFERLQEQEAKQKEAAGLFDGMEAEYSEFCKKKIKERLTDEITFKDTEEKYDRITFTNRHNDVEILTHSGGSVKYSSRIVLTLEQAATLHGFLEKLLEI